MATQAQMQDKKDNDELVFFELGEKAAIFRTQDGSIDLNRFSGITTGEIGNKNPNFQKVMFAIDQGILNRLNKKEDKPRKKESVVDLTNLADDQAKYLREASEFLKKLNKSDLLDRIPTIKNPYLVARMIEMESKGKNVSKRKRDDVVNALKERLEVINKEVQSGSGVMVGVTEEGEAYKIKSEQDQF